jgi:putative membrane protein
MTDKRQASPHPGPQEVSRPVPQVAAVARAPRAFALDGVRREAGNPRIEIEEAAGPAPFEPAPEPVTPPATSGLLSLASLFWSAVSLLFTLYLADAAWSLVLSLEAKAAWVGQLALGLIAIVALGLAIFLLKALLGLFRMRRVADVRARAQSLLAAPAAGNARKLVTDLREFYARDPGSAAGRAEITRVLDEPHDPRTLLVIAERVLLQTKDAAARRAIAGAAQRVSMVTALSPRAVVDVLFVLVQAVMLIRALSTIYGGRASGFGLLRLAGRVFAHLAATGGMAMADSLVSQFLGAGIAARLSARFGEGVLNGVLTARAGIAALDLCRPLPFIELPPVILSEVVILSTMQEKVAENPAA